MYKITLVTSSIILDVGRLAIYAAQQLGVHTATRAKKKSHRRGGPGGSRSGTM
jgi:hypothetical protein